MYAAICQHGSAVDAVVESYLRGHVPLPFVTVPPELTDMACALLACRLSAAQSEAELSEKMQAKEKAVIRFFEQIASGLIKFANLESAPAPSVWVNKQPGDAMFGIAGLRSRM